MVGKKKAKFRGEDDKPIDVNKLMKKKHRKITQTKKKLPLRGEDDKPIQVDDAEGRYV